MNGYLTLIEAAAEFNVNIATLRKAVWDGRIPATKRSVWFVKRSSMEVYMASFDKRDRGNVRAVARRLGKNAETIMGWCRAGKFPNAKQVSRYWHIPEKDVMLMEGKK